jgi:peptide/nickel transport system substrate-binding protein
LLAAHPNSKIIDVPGMKFLNMPMMTDAPPYNNSDVRQALKWAIDRKLLVERVAQGFGVPGNDNPLSRVHRYYNTELPQREYDADKAKFHIKKSGMENQTFEIHTADVGFDGAVDAVVLFQESAKKAGINMKVTRAPVDGYWKSVWMKVPFCTSYFASRPSEDMMFTLAYARGAAMNDTRWDNARFNELLLAARGELDDGKRRSMYWEMQRLIWEDSGQIIPLWVNHIAATSKKIVTPDKVSGSNEMDGHRCAERWWFA